jgi:hypothetical protein
VAISRSSAILFLVVAAATALHIYQFAFAVESFDFGAFLFLAWSLTPYIACVLVAWVSLSSIPACVGASLALCFDVAMHVTVFTSHSSTRGLGLLFMPFWNLVLITPLAMLLTWFAVRGRNSAGDAP